MKLKKLLFAGGAAAIVTSSTAYASIIDRPFFQVLGVVVVWGSDGIDGANDAPVVSDFVLLTPTTGTAGADLIDADGATVITGTLDAIKDDEVNVDGTVAATNPVTGGADNGTFTDDGGTAGVLDATDSLTAFGIDANSAVASGLTNKHKSSFYVASNAPFDIFATSSNFAATDDFNAGATALTTANISFDMDMTLSGNDGLAFGANAVTANPGTFTPGIDDLSDLATATKVFDGTSRTARLRGNLASQSVRFDNTYELDDGSGEGYDLSMGAGTVQADVTFTVYVP